MATPGPQSPPPVASTPQPTPEAAVPLSFASPVQSLITFTLKISDKLDEKNFLVWRQQVEPMINAHNLQNFIHFPEIPDQYLSQSDRELRIENPHYRNWLKQDQWLLSWLQSTLSSAIMPRVLGCAHSFQLWERIHDHFQKLTRAKARQLRTELRATNLESRTVEEYLLRIKAIVDALASVGDPVPVAQHIDVILEGLPEEYAPVVSVIESKFEENQLEEVEALLLAHEMRSGRFKKKSTSETLSINMTRTDPNSQSTNTENQNSQAGNTVPLSNTDPNANNYGNNNFSGAFRGRGGRHGRGGRGGRGRFGNIQCQVCFKFGHLASNCYHRFNQQFQAQIPADYQGFAIPTNSYTNLAPNPYPYPPPLYQNTWTRPNFNPYVPYAPRPANTQPQPSPYTQAHMTTATPATTPQQQLPWAPDTACSLHTTLQSQNIHQQSPFEGPDQIFIGNGQGLKVTTSGTSTFSSPINPQINLVLKKLIHVPNITKNLLSVSRFCADNDVFFQFHAKDCLVFDQATNNLLLHGPVKEDGLYEFAPFKFHHLPATAESSPASVSVPVASAASVPVPVASAASLQKPPESVESLQQAVRADNNSIPSCNVVISPSPSLRTTWHLRLGHPNHVSMNNIFSKCNISLSNKDVSEFCAACIMGKAHKLYAPPSETLYTTPLELIYSDLWGPAPIESTNKALYYVTFVDAATRFTWLYLLKRKSDTLDIFKQFKALVEKQFGFPIKAVQTDWGGEFRPFSTYLADLGIIHRLTCPHTSHQNGVVERKHRHIVDLSLSLLSHASLPLQYWDFAVQTAVYLINRQPSAPLNHIPPYTALFNKDPDYHFLRVFGCACFPLLRPYNAHKFDFRTHECLFLGYSTSHKGYKCLSPSGKIIVSKDVIFNEARFPYKELFPSQSKSLSPSKIVSLSPLPAPTESSSHNSGHFHTTQAQSNPSSPPTATEHNVPATTATAHNNTATTATDHTATATTAPANSTTVTTDPPPPNTIHNQPTNTHSMQTRSKSGINLPRLDPSVFLTTTEPKTTKQALQSPHWLAAMQAEYTALENNKTWSLVTLPPNRQAIGCKWVFRVKENVDGTVNKYKARLVAKGYHQIKGFDYHETFSPVVKPVTIRVILTLALTYKWPLHQLDVNNAFLNGTLDEEVYMEQPPGFVSSNSSLVCKLHKSLYGLKQAPRQWFEKLTGALLTMGFKSSKCDPSLFIFRAKNTVAYLLVYVDDIILTGNSPSILKVITTRLHQQFALKELGELDYFLGIEVHRQSTGSLLLTQSKYIRDLLNKTGMLECAPISSPMASNTKLSKTGSSKFKDPTLYRSVVGALQYATLTRPDLSYSVNKVCQFMADPLDSHWAAVKRILRYLRGTTHHGLLLQAANNKVPFNLVGFCDADWAADPDDRRSTSGSAVYFGPNLVSWWSRKQPLVARSSAEAEYRSLAHTTSEILWVQTLLHELHVKINVPVIHCDNQSTVALAHNPVLHARTKHMEIDLFFVREKVLAKQLKVSHIPGQYQIADALTKPLPTTTLQDCCNKLRVCSLSPPPSACGGVCKSTENLT